MPLRSLAVVLSGLVASVSLAQAFSFTAGSANECAPFNISWTGGTPPYQLTLVPIFGTPWNISIPSTQSSGTYAITLPVQASHKFVATLSDATGFSSGGSTQVLTSGTSLGGTCNTTDPAVDFTYELNVALQQCRVYTFSSYVKAIQPISIIGIVPYGNSTILLPPVGPTSYEWPSVNVASGTSIIFLIIDAEGRQGGSSDLLTVSSSDDTSCLNTFSPSSTGTPTSTSGPSSSSTPTPSSTSSGHISTAAVAGTVIGALLFLAVAVTLGLFCLRQKYSPPWQKPARRRDSHRLRSEIDLNYSSNRHSLGDDHYDTNTAATPAYSPYDTHLPSGHEPNPFILPPLQTNTDRSYEQSDSASAANISSPTETTSAGQRKRGMAGVSAYTPSRFIVHTDVEETMQPNEDGFIELPPQYSAGRVPLVGLQHQDSTTIRSSNVTSEAGPSHPTHASDYDTSS